MGDSDGTAQFIQMEIVPLNDRFDILGLYRIFCNSFRHGIHIGVPVGNGEIKNTALFRELKLKCVFEYQPRTGESSVLTLSIQNSSPYEFKVGSRLIHTKAAWEYFSFDFEGQEVVLVVPKGDK